MTSTDVDAGTLHRRRDDPAQVDRLAERELVGVEEAAPAVRAAAGSKRLEQRRLTSAAEVAAAHADVRSSSSGDERRAVDLEVVAGEPVAVEERAQARPRTSRVDGAAADAGRP